MMRSILLFLLFPLCFLAEGQVMSVSNMLNVVSISPSKSEKLISQNGFALKGVEQKNDFRVDNFYFKGKSRKSKPDSIKRSLTRQWNDREITITYETCSKEEYRVMNDE